MDMKRFLQITVSTAIFLGIQGKDLITMSDDKTCPKNMYRIYPVENNHTNWVCECLPILLYHSEDDSCYDAYRQGPCPSEHYLVLPPGEKEAKCEKNPCSVDGFVRFEDGCHFLWRSGPPCKSDSEYLGVDKTSYELKCSEEEYKLPANRLITSKSCPDNTIFHPLNEDDKEYVCECKPGRFNYPVNDSCLAVYRQGPCPPEHYIVISPEKVPVCEKNPCLKDGLVPFEGGCHKLGATGPPCYHKEKRIALDVDDEDFQLKCIYTIIHGAVQPGGIINAPAKACPEGSRRISTGFCKQVFQ